MFKRSADYADKSAIVLSGICMLHCILPILLALLLPYYVGSSILTNESLHIWAIVLVVPVSTYAIIRGFQKHRSLMVLKLASVGLLMLIFAAAFGHDLLGHTIEIIMTIIGSLLIILGHLRNAKLRNSAFNVV